MPSNDDINEQDQTDAHLESPTLIGSIKIKTDDLPAASKKIAEPFNRSIRDTATDLYLARFRFDYH